MGRLRHPDRVSDEPPSTIFEHKASSPGMAFRHRAEALERVIAARPDHRRVWLGLRDTWCDSKNEGMLWTVVASESQVARMRLTDIDFRRRRVTCAKGRLNAGDLERLCWYHPEIGMLFPQVTFLPDRIPYRVDALLAAPGGRFGVIEVDGEMHDPTWNKLRETAIGLPTLRLVPEDLPDRNLLARLSAWAATLPVDA